MSNEHILMGYRQLYNATNPLGIWTMTDQIVVNCSAFDKLKVTPAAFLRIV